MSEVFALKRVQYRGRDVSCLLQNENGPCPLIAIANILLLSRRLELGPRHLDRGFIPLGDLTNLVGEVVLHSIGRSGAAQEHQGQLVATVVELLPKLARGLDVNVKFSKCTALEFTEELTLFDALGIQLLHGWLVDPEERRLVNVIGDKSYNQLMNELVEYRASSSSAPSLEDSSSPPSSPTGAVIDSFLRDSASQLTYTGLVELHKSLQEGELAVFFRNNHFSTLVKHNAQLYCLVTDCAFLDQTDIVWELLADVDGDSTFYSSSFSRFVAKSSSSPQLIDIASLNFDHILSAAPAPSPPPSSSSSYSSHQPGATIALPPAAPSSGGGEEDEASMRLARELERQDREAADHSAALRLQQLEWDALQRQQNRQQQPPRQQQQQQQQQYQHQQQAAAQQRPPQSQTQNQSQTADQGGLCIVS